LGSVITGMGDCLSSVPGVRHLSWCLPIHPGQLSLAIPPWVLGRHNEYQPKGSDSLWLGSEGRQFMCGWQVKLSDPLCHTRAISGRFRYVGW